MEFLIQPVGRVPLKPLKHLVENLGSYFNAKCVLADRALPIPRSAYNEERDQYLSTQILYFLLVKAPKGFDRVLGVLDVDLYVPGLNFVFGEAEVTGKVAVISLERLRPEFYGRKPDEKLFLERTLKEAIHELGHTFGLRHCSNSRCIMYFSNSIIDTDRKGPDFCALCREKLERRLWEIARSKFLHKSFGYLFR